MDALWGVKNMYKDHPFPLMANMKCLSLLILVKKHWKKGKILHGTGKIKFKCAKGRKKSIINNMKYLCKS